ncbi:MAG: UDP-2,3-diacylglucosamine diphosphatase [Bacteroidia bacterium]|jgi:UDP-2,3-diacylglucosamine hydrolase|nr:UDP-2,3-diacylglucosamine diphosphatase [Bacteroidia bacterium]
MTETRSGKIYFASDFHLGIPDRVSSLEREKRIIRWLNSIEHDAEEIYLVGDLFDAWFEYKRVVPKGFVRLLAHIAAFTDNGIPVHVFTGNHDMWMFGYLEEECGVKLHKQPLHLTLKGKKFVIGHGDGLGPGDHRYKFIKRIFRSPVLQWLYARIHPNTGIGLADFFSRSGYDKKEGERTWLGDDKEYLMQYCHEVLKKEHIDFFIFGHRHLPIDKQASPQSRYINLGDWLRYNTYAVFDGETLSLKTFEG